MSAGTPYAAGEGITLGNGGVRRMTPRDVLATLDLMVNEGEEATRLTAWRHSSCGGYTTGIWEPDAGCSRCRYEVRYRDYVDQYLLVPVPPDEETPGAT